MKSGGIYRFLHIKIFHGGEDKRGDDKSIGY